MKYEEKVTELRRRINMMKEVITDCEGGMEEFLALYHHVRDIQPFLCEVLAEQWEEPSMAAMYRIPIVSDGVQIRRGEYLYHKEDRDNEDENAGRQSAGETPEATQGD